MSRICTFCWSRLPVFQKSLDGRRHFHWYLEIMLKGEALGESKHLIMLAVLRLGANAYGMRVRQEIAARTGRGVTDLTPSGFRPGGSI